jgi:hypothetical protein
LTPPLFCACLKAWISISILQYTFLNDFKVRQAICKIRISAHPLMIEIGRYKNLETKEWLHLCKLCITQKIEEEYHFLIDCPIPVYNINNSRKICYQKISELCSNFNNMSDKSKFYYLFTNEDLSIINIYGKCIIECLETRKLKQGLWYWNIFSLSVYIIKTIFKALNPTRNIVFIYIFYTYMYNCLQWQ